MGDSTRRAGSSGWNPSAPIPPVLRPLHKARVVTDRPAEWVARAGHMAHFLFQALGAVPLVLKQYPGEVWRLITNVTWGNGSLVVGGGTVGVILVISGFGGATVGMEGYNALQLLGMGPLTGAIASFATTRELGPLLAALAFAAQAGCRFTAQLGSMRITEEIDALDSIAIRPLQYLVTTRIVAAVVAIVPLYLVGLAAAYLSCQVTVLLIGSGSAGTYMHYFYQFLAPMDVVYSLVKAVVFAGITTFVQCYYGFFASGGPEGVGLAAGRAIRMCFVTVVFVNLLLTLGIWGISPSIRISG